MSGHPPGRAVQMSAEVLSTRTVGRYRHLTLLAPGVAQDARPGSFVALAVGGETSAMLLRRSFSLHRATTSGTYGGTVEVVVAAHGPGTHWIVEREVHDVVDVVGPLGRPFTLPRDPVACVLVGGGYGSAPLSWLAEQLRARGCRVDMVLGAASQDRLFGHLEARRVADSVVVTTDDGTAGRRGIVTDALPAVMAAAGTSVVYACGPMAMLRAVSAVAADHGAVAQVAVEESMACGVGVCMTCVLPVVQEDGRTQMVRSCVEGPVFRGDRVRWDAGSGRGSLVPQDCVGAPMVQGGRR